MQSNKNKNNNVAMERDLLGIILRDEQIYWTFKDRLKPEMFFDPRNAKVIRAMHAMASASRFEGFVLSAISGRIATDDFDANAYLWTLRDNDDARPENVFDMVDDLRKLYSDRQLDDLAARIKSGRFGEDADPDERIVMAVRELQAIGDVAATSKRIGIVAERVVAQVCDGFERGKSRGVKCGLAMVDDLVDGFMPGDVIVIAGAPGSGKTALGIQIAMALAKEGPGTFFSQEMKDVQIAGREIARRANLSSRKISRGPVNATEVEQIIAAAHTLRDLPLDIDDTSGLNHIQIRSRLYRQKRLEGCTFGIVDHLLYCGPTEKRQSPLDRVSENMKGFKFAAKALNIPLIILAQLKLEYTVGDWTKIRMPQNSDIYGGSQVEHDSDIIMFVHRQEVLLKRKKPAEFASEEEQAKWARKVELSKGVAETSIGKFRDGPGDGSRKGHYDAGTLTFSDLVKKGTEIDYAEAAQALPL